MRFGRKWVCAAQPRMNFYRFGAFQTIPHPLRGSSLYTREPMSLCDFRLCATEKTNAEFKFSNPKTTGKRRLSILLQSPSAPAPSRREPLICAIFRLFATEEARTKIQAPKPKIRTLFLLRQYSWSLYAFLREEGVTRERDGRSLQN